LHKKDREKISDISQEIGVFAGKLGVLDGVTNNLTALSTNQSEQTLKIDNLSQKLDSISTSLRNYITNQNTQTAALNNIVEKISSPATPQLTLPSDVVKSINSASKSLESISSNQSAISLKNNWPLLAIALPILFLLPPVLKIADELSSSTPKSVPDSIPTPTPIPIPVPNLIPTPTPIPIPVPNLIPTPTPIAISTYYIRCPIGHHLCTRQLPSLSANIVYQIPCNTPGVQIVGATVDRDGEIWAPIQ
jgi:ABC-type transporter Mla subunit MlaD